MKETVKTSRTAGYLEKIFRVLNEYYFGGKIEEPIITIQSSPRAYGHVTVAKSWAKGTDGDRRHELNLGAGTLGRPVENVVATMLHEMVHLYNIQTGVKDTSRGGMYHNKRFRDTAETVDLQVGYHPAYGWTITEPTEPLIDFIVSQGWEDIKMSRDDGYTAVGIGGKGTSGGINPKPPRKPSSTRKYICPCCGNSFRATKNLNVLCLDCGKQFVIDE